MENCSRFVMARGWCQKHYARWQRHGDPSIVLPHGGPEKTKSNLRNAARNLKVRGFTYQEIGDVFGVTRQRAQQLVAVSKEKSQELRDLHNNECHFCHKKKGKLEIHHISYVKGSRVVLLCTSCHKKLDHINGPSLFLGEANG